MKNKKQKIIPTIDPACKWAPQIRYWGGFGGLAKWGLTGDGYDDGYDGYEPIDGWDLSLFTNPTDLQSLIYFISDPQATEWSPDGYELFVIGKNNTTNIGYGIYKLTTTEPYNINKLKYGLKNKALGLHEYQATGLGNRVSRWNNDGTVFYTMDGQVYNNILFKYPNFSQRTASVPYDISTLKTNTYVYSFASFAQLADVSWKSDGTRLFASFYFTPFIMQIDLSTPWDIDTIDESTLKFTNVNLINTSLRRMWWNNDGSKIYISTNPNGDLLQASLSVPWDITSEITWEPSFTYSNAYAGVSIGTSTFKHMWGNGGLKLFLQDQDKLYQFTASIPYELSSLTANNSFTYIVGSGKPFTSFDFSPDGEYIFVLQQYTESSFDYEKLKKFSMSTPWDVASGLTLVDESENFNAQGGISGTFYGSEAGINWSNDGYTFFKNNLYQTWQYKTTAPYDVGSLKLDHIDINHIHINTVDGYEGLLSDFRWKNDGTKIWVIGPVHNAIHEMNVTTPWDITTATYNNVSYKFLDIIDVNRFSWNDDGTILYITSSSLYNSIIQYSASTPFDITTLSSRIDRPAIDGYTVSSASWSYDGSKVFFYDTSEKIHQYSASSLWDAGSLSYDLSYNLSHIDNFNSPASKIRISDDGYDLFVSNTGTIFSIALSSSNDLSTASYQNVPSKLINQSTGITWGNNGNSLYSAGSSVFQYPASTPYDITTVTAPSYYVGDVITSPSDVVWNNDGTKAYFGNPNFEIVEYNTTVPYTVSYLTYGASKNIYTLPSPMIGISGFTWKPDGTKFYACDSNTGAVYQYTASTAFDISTLTYDSVSFATGSTSLQGVKWNNAGTSLYIATSGSSSIRQFTVSTPWDISTATTVGQKIMNVATYNSTPTGFEFGDNGNKIFFTGISGTKSVYQVKLISAYDVSSAKLTKVSIASQTGTPNAIIWNGNGTKAYVLSGVNPRPVYQYSASTPYVAGSLSYDSVSFNISQDTNPLGISWNNDGTKFYACGNTTGSIYQYTAPTPYSLTGITYDSVSFDLRTGTGGETSITNIFWGDGGTKLYATGSSADRVYQYTASSAYNVSTLSFSASFSVVAQDGTPRAVWWNSTGTKMFLLGNLNDTIYQYTASTPWSVSSLSYDSVSLSVTSVESNPTGMSFNNDGTELYFIGTSTDTIYQYSGSAWNLSTFVNDVVSLVVNSEDTDPSGITFNNDGTKMHVMGRNGKYVLEYTLSTPYSLSTAKYGLSSLSVTAQDSNPKGIAWKTDGTKFYIVGSSSTRVYQYSAPTPWSFNGASYDGIVLLVPSSPEDLFWKSDGTQLYVVHSGIGVTINQYTLSTPWLLSSSTLTGTYTKPAIISGSVTGMYWSSSGSKLTITTSRDVFQFTASVPWSVTSLTFDNIYFEMSESGSGGLNGIAFSSDGLKMQLSTSLTVNKVYQYNLTSAFNIDNVNVPYKVFSSELNQQGTNPRYTWADSGSRIYIHTGTKIQQYNVGIPYDVREIGHFPVSEYTIVVNDKTSTVFEWKNDGTKIYFLNDFKIYQFSASVPWDISTITYDSIVSKRYSINENSQTDMQWKPDGSSVYLYDSNYLIQYDTTNYNLSTISGAAISTIDENTSVSSISWKEDGLQFIIGSAVSGGVYPTTKAVQYTTSTPWNLAQASFSSEEDIGYIGDPRTIEVSNDGYKIWIEGPGNYYIYSNTGNVIEMEMTSPWDLSTSVRYHLPIDLQVNPDSSFGNNGNYLYTINSGNIFRRHTLSQPFLIEDQNNPPVFDYSATFINNQDSTPQSWYWRPDGKKFYKLSASRVRQYSSAIPWRPDTLYYDSVMYDTFVKDGMYSTDGAITWSPNGQRLFVMSDKDLRPAYIYQYETPDAWDLSKISFVKRLRITSETTDSDSGLVKTFQNFSFGDDGNSIIQSRYNVSNHGWLSLIWKFSEVPPNPDLFPNLIADINVDNAVDGGGTTNSIPDSSGNGFTFTGSTITLTTSDPAYNGHASIDPTNTQYLQNINIPFGTFTVYIVAQYIDASGVLFGAGATSATPNYTPTQILTTASGLPAIQFGNGTPEVSCAKPTTGPVSVWTALMDKQNPDENYYSIKYIRIDPQGQTIKEQTANSFSNFQGVTIGVRWLNNQTATSGHQGTASRMIICAGAHDAQTREDIINYLKAQYAIVTI